ncbi:hypothetical protein CRYUN_Cryun20dG0099400 [Craigia yunnanensis]
MQSGSALSAAAKQAEKLRKDGNKYFKKNRFRAAIDAFTEAITLCPNVPVYWTNRALCHLRRNNWLKVEEDCRRAIQLDHSSVKAHYMLGLALLQKQELDEGVKELEKAMDLGRGASPKSYVVDGIWEACETALKEKQFLDDSQPEGFLGEASISHLKQLEALEQVFRKAGEADIPREVGKFDPVTRESLDQSQLIPNLAIREAVRAYLDKHGWAYKTD